MSPSIDPPQPGTPTRRDEPLDFLRLALTFAMLATSVKFLRIVYLRVGQHSLAWTTRDILWMAPLALALVFAVVLLIQRVAGIYIKPLGTTRWLAFTAITLCAFSVLLHFTRVSPIAWLILSIGIGHVLASRLTEASGWWMRSVTRLGIAMAAVFSLLGATERTSRVLRDWRTEKRAMPASVETPNVVLLILDTVRASNLSLYGYARQTTPELAAVAAEGTSFDLAIAPSSWTLPSHGSFFTGHRSGSLGVDWRKPYDGRFPTLSQAFQASNYATGAFAGNLAYTTWESGLNRGFDHFEDYATSLTQLLWSANLLQMGVIRQIVHAESTAQVLTALRKHDLGVAIEQANDPVEAEQVVSNFLDWHAARRGRRFFAFLNFYDAHAPRRPPATHRTLFGNSPSDLDLYDASIKYMDDQLKVLVDSLRSRGELDRTILVVTSDHGEQFGEHGLTSHGNSLYAQVLHVPLVIRFPSKVPAGVRVQATVSLQNLPATIAELAGLHSIQFPGRSLPLSGQAVTVPNRPVLSEVGRIGDAPGKAPNARGAMQSVVDDRWHYVRGPDGREELFNLGADPAEGSDLAGAGESQARLVRFRALLSSLLRDEESIPE